MSEPVTRNVRAECEDTFGRQDASCVALPCRDPSTLCLSLAQDLAACQHTLIGDETLGMKGISGGERRRVGVGLQARPASQPCVTPPAMTGMLQWRPRPKAAL